MPVKPERLQKRGNVYWLRVRVPADLVPVIGKSEIHESLRTTDPKEAKLKARIGSVRVDQQFRDARRRLEASRPATSEPTEAELWGLATNWFVSAEKRSSNIAPQQFDCHEAQETIARVVGEGDGDDEASQLFWSILEGAGFAEPLPKFALGSLPPSGTPPARPIKPWHAQLHRFLSAALVEHERRNINRFARGNLELDPRFKELSAGNAVKSVAKVTVAELLDRQSLDPTKLAPSPKTVLKRKAQAKLFCELLGSRTLVSSIGRSEARTLFETLRKLPANATKRFPDLTLAEIAALPHEGKGRLMSATTINSYMAAFSSAMSFAVAEGYVERNPAEGLVAPNDGPARKELRRPFSDAELTRIFNAPIYTGCVDDEGNYAKAGSSQPRRAKFWVPLIALFTGMRLNEILQLTEDDVSVVDGIELISVRATEDGAKRVKTRAGERTIPVHHTLRRIGLLQHVETVRIKLGAGARLFPDVAAASTSYYSDNMSKWFARFLDKVDIRQQGKTFHSFRHNYRDALREADLSQEKVRALGGWSSGRTEDDYGSGLKPASLSMAIAAVGYPKLDLSHLFS